MIRGKPNPRVSELARMAETHEISIQWIKEKAALDSAITARLPRFRYTTLDEYLKGHLPKRLILAFDHLEDPQNFGALCRSAEAFGVSAIIIPKDRSVQVTAGVYHSSVGTVESLQIIQTINLSESLKKLKEIPFWIIGAQNDPQAYLPQNIPDFSERVLVLGNELRGLSERVRETCDCFLRIDMVGEVGSLNVAQAGSILMYLLKKSE